ncbi:MAG: 4-hydroxy-3-methylbut-2-en-1-yl diphosphate synthase [Desulfococcus sp. 4484_241]|nr:MAG: 4-hydroxy-3-methylbut-2-en-1-yl diphosphate synthase [Desulfococcus sp. 4484_241]
MGTVIKRRKSRSIRVGNTEIGGDAPISVQSMTTTDTSDVEATVAQIVRLQEAGCDIVRVAVPDRKAAEALSYIKENISIPLIADIHFNWRLAVAALESGVDGLRINPGNMGGEKKTLKVIDAAAKRETPIRIGVNSGSVERDLLEKHGGPTVHAMVESALRYITVFERAGFYNMKISIKASDVFRTVEAYRRIAKECDYPLHVGVTEAGGLFPGLVKSSLGIGMLLAEGIGDTIRVSLTRDPAEEVRAGFEILRALGIRNVGPEIISCPTCGRCGVDLFAILDKVEQHALKMKAPIKVAVMGCVVNGPGEAKDADLGIAGGAGKGVLFKKGEIVRTVKQEQLAEALLMEMDAVEKEWHKEHNK